MIYFANVSMSLILPVIVVANCFHFLLRLLIALCSVFESASNGLAQSMLRIVICLSSPVVFSRKPDDFSRCSNSARYLFVEDSLRWKLFPILSDLYPPVYSD